MIKKLLLLLVPIWIVSCQTTPDNAVATEQEATITQSSTEISYDSTLAKQLEADDYGMSPYVIAFLKRGPNREPDSTKRAALQTAHMNNIQRLIDEGKLVLAGRFMDNGDVRGIYIFNVRTIAEAKALTATDPAVKSGSLEMELHPWYGSAAIKQVNKIHQKITKLQ